MTEAERAVLKETVAAVSLIMERLQWHDLGHQFYQRIEGPLREMCEDSSEQQGAARET